MNEKQENPIQVLFSFAGEARGKMPLAILLAVLGELCGMLPFLAAARLANEAYAGTATLPRAALWAGGAALGIALRTLFCTLSSARSHKVAFTILRNIRRAIADKMRRVPMGVMLETPSGVYKILLVDNVGRLEDSIAHVVPEAPSQIAAPLACLALIFALDWRMGPASLVTLPLSVLFIIGMMRGQLTLPVFIACIVIPIGFIAPLLKLAFGSEQLTTIAANLKPVRQFLATPEQRRPAGRVPLDGSAYSFENVSFSYNAAQEVLHGVTFRTQPGAMTAIVGPSGSGKTTLCSLIARFWDVQEGQVLVGGLDVRDHTADSLLRHISMVFQNVYLFHDTLENNIRFGDPDATHEQVVGAAQRAQCHDFIMALPEGHQTIVGEGGCTLSGGEKQRISIARAILKDAPIVILDEATSSVDPENEHALLLAQEGLYRRFWRQHEASIGWRLDA